MGRKHQIQVFRIRKRIFTNIGNSLCKGNLLLFCNKYTPGFCISPSRHVIQRTAAADGQDSGFLVEIPGCIGTTYTLHQNTVRITTVPGNIAAVSLACFCRPGCILLGIISRHGHIFREQGLTEHRKITQECHLCKFCAIGKGILANFCNSGRKRDESQIVTVGECILSNLCYSLRQRDAAAGTKSASSQVCHTMEGIVADRSNTIVNVQRSHLSTQAAPRSRILQAIVVHITGAGNMELRTVHGKGPG